MNGSGKLLLGVAALVLLAAPQAVFGSTCTQAFGATPITFLFFADPGTFSGSAENKYFVANAANLVDYSSDYPACGRVQVGMIMKQKVALIMTGIGPTTAGMCTQQVLDRCGKNIKDAIYMGTSGWSSAIGGILNPPVSSSDNSTSCASANPATKPGQTVRVGDICVSPISMNWMCTKASWTQQCVTEPNGNLCFRPHHFNGPDASFLYGKCFFTSPSNNSIALTLEVLKTASAGSFATNVPPANAAIRALNALYWNRTSEGTGITYPTYNPVAIPTVFNHTVCAEVDGQFFYSGVPWEITARDYTAEAIKMAGFRDASGKDVIAVSAMEAIGFMQAFEQYNALATKQIPYTNVRGNSNWLHHPVRNMGNGTWDYNGEFPEDFMNGYGYAIASYSSLVLSWLQQRCLGLAGLKPAAAKACTFSMATYA